MQDEKDEERDHGGPEAAVEPARAVSRDPGLLKRAIKGSTSSIGDREKKKLPQRKITFQVDASICAPGVFDEDFEITLTSLNPGNELEAARNAKGDPVTMAMLMARSSMESLNGFPISRAEAEDEWLWEALGSGGRNLVMMMFTHVGTPGETAMGKAVDSLRLH